MLIQIMEAVGCILKNRIMMKLFKKFKIKYLAMKKTKLNISFKKVKKNRTKKIKF